MTSRSIGFVALAVLVGVAACDAPPSSTDLPPWQPSDHDKEPNPNAGQEQQRTAAAGGGRAPGADMVVEASWQQQCAACHGPIGHGDGPTGPMVHAADLTVTSMTDAQLTDIITHGKGKMPPFDLPPKVVTGLIARIRASRGH